MTGLPAFGDHVLGGLGAAVLMWVAIEYAGLTVTQPFLEYFIGLHVLVFLTVVAVLYIRRPGSAAERARGAVSVARSPSVDDETFNQALQESETLRRNVVGVQLDEDDREAVFEESPTFAGEYLEAEARSP